MGVFWSDYASCLKHNNAFYLICFSVLEDIGRLLCADVHSDDIIEAAKGLLSDEHASKRRKILSELLLNLEDRSELETRDEDKDWFKGRDVRWGGGVGPCFDEKSLFTIV